jgi:hypothetical protein
MRGLNGLREDESKEVRFVFLSDALVNIRTVMVVCRNASIALVAVEASKAL